MVLNRTLSESSKEARNHSRDNQSLDIPTMVPIHPGDVGECSKAISIITQRDLVAPQTEQEFILSQGVPRLETQPMLRNLLHQKEFL